MTASDLTKAFLRRQKLRIGPAMSEYVLARLTTAGGADAQVPVIGDDARIGVPVRRIVELSSLLADASPASETEC